jgi:parallel beta-helix repeat protein
MPNKNGVYVKIRRFKGALLPTLMMVSIMALVILLLSGAPSASAQTYTSRAPISINGGNQFTSANGVTGGSGTASDPYIIEDWAINASASSEGGGINIQNTTAYFVVRNCLVENGYTVIRYGIYLDNVINGRVENNTCENNWNGIFLYSSDHNILANNTCGNNYYDGIDLYASDNYNNLTNNTCGNNSYGIRLDSSSNDNLTGNTCDNNWDSGICLIGSGNNTLTNNTCDYSINDSGIYLSSSSNTLDNNTCSGNGDSGIYLESSSYNNLTNDNCSGNYQYGIYLSSSSGNIITLNYLLNNTNNAYDSGTNSWDSNGRGNYWSDWQPGMVANGVTLTSSNGITVDQPRPIAGGINYDNYPLVISIRTATALAITPLSFTLQSGNSTTLTATLKDNANNPLANKTISWSKTAGSLLPTSGTTNSSGQVSVTYTAPTVTTQTSVTVTASFAGDNQYQSSSGLSSGTITAENENVKTSTTLSVSPSSFTIHSKENIILTATLNDNVGNPLANKTISWTKNAGGLSPTSGTTNSSGQISVTYTAPTVTTQTSVTVTASFAGDNQYQSGSGNSYGTITAENTIVAITTVEQLQAMKNNLSAHYVLGNDIDASATSSWNGGAGFKPIGTGSSNFTGSLDGRGYKITNLYENYPDNYDIGLFGLVGSGGVVENVGLVNENVIGDDNVGGLVGLDNGGTISNCYSTGTVSGRSEVGGLVGGNSYEGNVSNCYSTSTVSGSGYYVGGLVGKNSHEGNVSNCYSTSTVSGSGYYVGGLVGWNFGGNVSNCYSTGTVSGRSEVGGLVGANGGTVSNSFWDNQTSGQATSDGGTGETTALMKTQSTFTNAGWGFVNVWSISSSYNNGYPFLTAFMEALSRTATALVISPSTFTLYPGENKTFIATLRVENNALANKTINWSATAGSLSASSSTTNSSGWTSITYTAPQVTSQTTVTVSAYFMGDSQYQASYNSSYGTILPQTVKQSTSLSVFPSYFALFPGYSGQVQSLIATLRDENNNPIPNETITCSATSGSINPSSGTTDALGQFSAVYTAPAVTAGTSATITMSFAGDNQYGPSSTTSSGIPATLVIQNIPASTGGTVVINIIETNVTINVLVVPPNSLNENTSITVLQLPPENTAAYTMLSNVFDIGPNGTSFTLPVTLTLPYQLQAGVSEDNLAIYYYNTDTNSWELVGGIVNNVDNTVSVQIDHLSEYAVMAKLPATPQVGGGIPLIEVILAVLGVSAAAAASSAWISHRHAMGKRHRN